MAPEKIELDPAGADAVQAICDYVSTPLFRSARIEELVIDDNPYRRPVRPEDLNWLRFEEPVEVASAARLSALLAHRMLLNIYDSERCLLPEQMTDEKWQDHEEFYSPTTRARGERIRPLLEDHTFAFARRAAAEDLDDCAASHGSIMALLERVAERTERQADELVRIESGSSDPGRICRTLTIQLIGQRVAAPLHLTAPFVEECLKPNGVPFQSFAAGMTVGHSVRLDTVIAELAEQHGLGWQPHKYFQFYLPTTLSLMNYLSECRRRPTESFRFVGALAARTLSAEALVGRRSSLCGERQPARETASGEAPERIMAWLREQVVETIGQRFGARSLREFTRGVLEYTALQDAHHVDLTGQLRWVDSAKEYQEKALRLQTAITDYQLEVELDTFVETWEECSTAHVHDDDRLVVVESGEMEFWNCFGEIHKFGPGDAMFVPKHRLHGSVVRSGTCVYHQPVITPDINRQYG